MTLQTVEGIIESTDFNAAQGQTSWESKMENLLTWDTHTLQSTP
jgi:hypothetical protein